MTTTHGQSGEAEGNGNGNNTNGNNTNGNNSNDNTNWSVTFLRLLGPTPPSRVLPEWLTRISMDTLLALERLAECDPQAAYAAMRTVAERYPKEPPHEEMRD